MMHFLSATLDFFSFVFEAVYWLFNDETTSKKKNK